jgi:hypothetical protein
MESAGLAARGFFSASPREVIDDLVNHVNLCAADTLEALELTLREEQVGDAESIKHGIDQFQLKFQRTIDAKMDKFEEYALRNIFRVPDDLVITDVDRAGAPEPAPEPVAVLDSELLALAERVQGEIATRRALVAELRQLRTEAAAQQAYAPALAPLLSIAPGAPAAADANVRLHAALQTLETNVHALDAIRAKILHRIAGPALATGADAAAQGAPTIMTGDLQDLACLSRTLRAIR